jgi:hypothetical protein
MKSMLKSFLLIAGVMSFSQSFAQWGHSGRRDQRKHGYASQGRPKTSVSIFARLPFGAVGVTLGGKHYHYYDGFYYEPVPEGYLMIEPPVGIIVPVPPPRSVYIVMGGRPYYRYENVYYMVLDDNRYKVVPEPSGEQESAPTTSGSDSYEKFILDGKTYYKKGSKYFKAKLKDDGEVLYEEIGETSK